MMGGFETLEEVIDFYSDKVNFHPNAFVSHDNINNFPGMSFSDKDKAALKAFLLTLSDYDFITNEKWSNPFEK